MAVRRIETGDMSVKTTNRSKARRRPKRYRDVLKCACEPLERRRLFAIVSWVSNVDGNWSVGANWSTGSVPGPNDTAVLDVPGRNITITYTAGGLLQLNNLVNNESLIINGAAGASWTGGTWDGAGVVTISTLLSLSGSADKILKDGQTLINNGTTTLSGNGNIVGQVGATISNSGTFDIRSDADITFPSGVGDGNFNNNGGGIVLKSLGSTAPGAMTEIGGAQGFTFNNNGDCQVLQGTLGLGDNQNASLSRAGTFEISAGAVLDYLRGVHSIVYIQVNGPDPMPSISGAGTLRISGGIVQHFGLFAVHQIDMNAGQFFLQQNFTAPAGTDQRITSLTSEDFCPLGTADILNLAGGVFGGNGGGIYSVNTPPPPFIELPGLVLAQTFNWSGGSLSGTGRLVVDTPVTSATFTTTTPKAIAGGYGLDLLGQVLWKDNSTIAMSDGSAVWIHPSGTLWDQNDGTISGIGNIGNLWNNGNLLKLNGTGTTTIDAGVDFINSSGFRGTNDIPPLAVVVVPTSVLEARLDIRTGTVAFGGTSTNTNVYLIKPGATLSFVSGTHINGTNNNLNATAKILGVDGGGTINFGDAATFTGDSRARLDVGQTNFGGGTYQFNNTAGGGQVVHTGTFTGGLTGTIGGDGAIKVLTSLVWNSGRFVGNGLATSFLLIDSGATLTITSGDRSTENFYSIENRGTILWTTSPGVLDINGDFRQTVTGNFVSGFVSPPILDRLRVAGNVAIDGLLTLNLGSTLPANGQSFTLIENLGVNPIAGTFIGLPQGDTITIGSTSFLINYLAGDGNDLVLTAIVFPVITLSTPAPVVEGTGGTTSLVFTVNLSEPVILDVLVNFATTSGSATSGQDFTPTTGTLTIPAGQSTGTITVPITPDALVEPTQTFTLTLSAPVHGTLGTPSSAIGRIVDDDGPPQVSFSQTTFGVLEGAGVATVTVSRTNPSIAVTVNYATSDDTAIAGVDYTAVSGTLTLAVGVIANTFDVPIIDRPGSQPARSFNVTLSNPVGGAATLVDGTAVVTIFDDDAPPPTVSVGNATVTEGISGLVDAVFTVTLSSPSASALTVDFTTVDGTAVAGSDYVATSGTVTFAPNQLSAPIRIPVKTDFVEEVTETFSVLLSNPSGGATLVIDTGTGTILNQTVHTVTVDALHPYRYIDSANSFAIIGLRGPGTGTLKYLGLPSNDAKEIILDNTTGQSLLLVRTAQRVTFLQNITVNGSIGAIDGPTLNLQGNLTVAGALPRLRLNNLLGQNVVNIGSNVAAPTSLIAFFNSVIDTTLTSANPISFLRVANWLDSTAGADITAPSMGMIGSVGGFQADITLSGSLNSLRVGRTLSNSDIRVGGSINLVFAGAMNGSNVFAGVNDTVTTLPASATDFANTTSTIKLLAVGSRAANAFSSTRIAAPVVGNVALGAINTSNGGTTFGVAGNSITSVVARSAQIIRKTNTSLSGSPFSEDDLAIRLTV